MPVASTSIMKLCLGPLEMQVVTNLSKSARSTLLPARERHAAFAIAEMLDNRPILVEVYASP
jgi:hypothetical protein